VKTPAGALALSFLARGCGAESEPRKNCGRP